MRRSEPRFRTRFPPWPPPLTPRLAPRIVDEPVREINVPILEPIASTPRRFNVESIRQLAENEATAARRKIGRFEDWLVFYVSTDNKSTEWTSWRPARKYEPHLRETGSTTHPQGIPDKIAGVSENLKDRWTGRLRNSSSIVDQGFFNSSHSKCNPSRWNVFSRVPIRKRIPGRDRLTRWSITATSSTPLPWKLSPTRPIFLSSSTRWWIASSSWWRSFRI